MSSVGFIILRHVNSSETNQYWIHCYNCIRKYYPENYIVIIDDNSNPEFISNIQFYKTQIIYSEFHKRGELLPYYYYAYNHFFDIAVIIHDSVFINKYIDMNVDKYKIIWNFEHYWDQIEDETRIINVFDDSELLDFYHNKSEWTGCFGGMVVITHEFLKEVNLKYKIDKLLDVIICRYNRCSFERVIACILQKMHPIDGVLLGNIHAYMDWCITFNQKDDYCHLPMIKVWSGR